MIISASRRTDIPAYFSEWFFNRVKEKTVFVRNPMNHSQIRKINLAPDAVDAFVFWTKNPEPMLEKLFLLKEYVYYFQFTLNPYQQDIETNLPPKNKIIETFKKLSEMISKEKIIWRYDPVLLNGKYNIQYHLDNFEKLACSFKGCTEKVTFSFIDFYKKIEKSLKAIDAANITTEEKNIIAENFSKIAKENNFAIDTCAEGIDLSKYGINHARCIDDRLITKIIGSAFAAQKDKNLRLECGCVKSTDIGEYDTCLNGCVYCYANHSLAAAAKNAKNYTKTSPLLIGNVKQDDILTETNIRGEKNLQQELF